MKYYDTQTAQELNSKREVPVTIGLLIQLTGLSRSKILRIIKQNNITAYHAGPNMSQPLYFLSDVSKVFKPAQK